MSLFWVSFAKGEEFQGACIVEADDTDAASDAAAAYFPSGLYSIVIALMPPELPAVYRRNMNRLMPLSEIRQLGIDVKKVQT